jgi:hypothetical protein
VVSSPSSSPPNSSWMSLSRSFLAWPILGIVWSLAHVGMELAMGSNPYKLLVVPCMLVWVLILVLATKGRCWALYAAIACGALGCYFVAVSHLAPGVHITWFGVVPWMIMAEQAGGAWVPAYNLLIYAGILIGAAILWTGARTRGSGPRLRRASFAILVGVLVVVSGAMRVMPEGGAALLEAVAWWSRAGAVACGVMLSAALL